MAAKIASVERLPGGLPVFEAQRQCVSALVHFAGEDQVRTILFDLGADDLDLAVRLEGNTHVVEKLLWTKENLERIRAALHCKIDDRFSTRRRNKFQFLDDALDCSFGACVILGRRLCKYGSGEKKKCGDLREVANNRAGRFHRGPSSRE